MDLTILYRGPLSSCNYGCDYCPFAKRKESRVEHARDQRALERFVEWVTGRTSDVLSIFFTPWGEALTHRRYRDALVHLSRLPNVRKAAIQTNLSLGTAWAVAGNVARLGLWATYHPTQVSRSSFRRRAVETHGRGIPISVGIVGLRENVVEAEAIRRELPPEIPVWVNAYKREVDYYTPGLIERYTAIDPLFPLNNRPHPSFGKACRTGESVISVDGEGTVRRCHFVPEVIGNIYEPGFEIALRPRPCPNTDCGCHIGYVHLNELRADALYGEGILERIPRELTRYPQITQ